MLTWFIITMICTYFHFVINLFKGKRKIEFKMKKKGGFSFSRLVYGNTTQETKTKIMRRER